MPTAASTGEAMLITEEGVARRSSRSIGSLQLRICGNGVLACPVAEFAAHPCPDLLDRRLGGGDPRRKSPPRHHPQSLAATLKFYHRLGNYQYSPTPVPPYLHSLPREPL